MFYNKRALWRGCQGAESREVSWLHLGGYRCQTSSRCRQFFILLQRFCINALHVFFLITFLDFGTDDWFSDQFDDLVFGEIDELTRDDDLVNKQGGFDSYGLDGNQFENFG